MNHAEWLKVRGWYAHPRFPKRWTRPGAVIDMACTTLAAYDRQYREDVEDLNAFGSVAYKPTAEHVQTSVLCVALTSKGSTERDVIDHLFIQSEERRKETGLYVEALKKTQAMNDAYRDAVMAAYNLGRSLQGAARSLRARVRRGGARLPPQVRGRGGRARDVDRRGSAGASRPRRGWSKGRNDEH